MPLVFVSESPVVQLIALFLFIFPLTFIYTWVFNGSGGSVLIVVLLHGAENGWSTYFERNLFPVLLEADAWLLFRFAIIIIVAGISVFLIRRQTRQGIVERV